MAPCSPERKAKISAALLGKPKSAIARQRMSEAKKGKPGHPCGAAQRAAVSAARNGKPLSEEHKAKLRAAKLANPVRYWLGRERGPQSEEWRRKIGQAGIGRKYSAETLAKRSASMKGHRGYFTGRKHSEATKQKLREANRGKAPKHTLRVRYGEHVFRSGFEVRVARALDALGVKWEYEPKRFDFGDFTYAPDFYLPDDDAYWEVKGWYGPDSQRKVERFRREVSTPLVLVTKSCVLALERCAKGVDNGGLRVRGI